MRIVEKASFGLRQCHLAELVGPPHFFGTNMNPGDQMVTIVMIVGGIVLILNGHWIIGLLLILMSH